MQNLLKTACLSSALILLGACEAFIPAPPAGSLVAADAATLSDSSNVVVLVPSQQSASRLLVNAARRGYQLTSQERLEGLDLILLDFKRPRGVSGAVAIGDMEKMEPSATAGLDHVYTFQAAQGITPSQPRTYAGSMMAWPKTGCPAMTKIGMIDGALNLEAPSLANANIELKDFSGGAPGAVGHGTAIADILVGPGRLSDARLYSASVVINSEDGKSGAGVFEMIRAIDWMQSSGVSLINISLAGPYNKLLDRAVARATSKGLIIIAAVGNDGPDAPPRYPAAFKSVIAVTAIDSAREIYTRAVRGDHVDFAAPGVDVYVQTNDAGIYLSGTSVATPFVTALIASDSILAKARTAVSVRTALSQNSEDLGSAGRDPVFGAGLVRGKNACK